MKTSAAQIAQVAQPTNPGERIVNGLTADELPDEHNLSSCAAEFCDGDLSRYLDLYYLVFHAPSEQPITKKKALPTWRGWFAALFQGLRQAVQH
jgi:hypothetical protein